MQPGLLVLVADRGFAGERLEAATEAAFRGGADVLQVRERKLEGRELLAFAQDLVAAAQRGARAGGRSARIVVNRRLDIALALAADGAHLGFDAVPVGDARALLEGPCGTGQAWIGVSAHSPAEISDAHAAGADYAQLAPIFDPGSKPAERPALGLAALRQSCLEGFPVIAQGGVTPELCPQLRAAGAAGVAVTASILASDDPERSARALRRELDR